MNTMSLPVISATGSLESYIQAVSRFPLLTQEQDLILSAFEQLQHDGGRRKREQVRLDGGNRPYDAAMFRQLVAEAGPGSEAAGFPLCSTNG